MMKLKRFVLGAGLAVAMVAGVAVQSGIVSADGGIFWATRPSYALDCAQRPAGTVCVQYNDGYIRLVKDSITGWEMSATAPVQIAHGLKADYYHLLGTNLQGTVYK